MLPNSPTLSRRTLTGATLTVAILLGVGLGLALGLPSEVQPPPPSSAEAQVQTRKVAAFHGLSFTRRDGNSHGVQIMVRSGDEQQLAVVALPGQHQSVQTRVIDGILYIQLDRDMRDNGDLRIQIATPRLRSIRMDGVSSVQINGGLRMASVRLEASRGAQITARRLGTRQLNVTVLRGGRIMIAGHTGLLRARASSGVIEARDLEAEVAQVSSVERSRVEVYVLDRLEAYARDRASILYRTMPRRVLRDLDGSSRLQML